MTSILVLAVIAVIAYFILRDWRSLRPDSSQPAGHLPGPGTFSFDIVGESKYQDVLESICGGKTGESAEHYAVALLYLEDSNPFDDKAVRVDIEGRTVGYLARNDARSYRKQLMNFGHACIVCNCSAVIVGGWKRSPSNEGHFGVKLDLPVA